MSRHFNKPYVHYQWMYVWTEGQGEPKDPAPLTPGLNRDGAFAFCHYNKKEPPQTHTKLKTSQYTDAANMYALAHT